MVPNSIYLILRIFAAINKFTMETINWRNHIHSDSQILLGKPTIKGTRISVELILELFTNGWTFESILESYPTITNADIRAVFAYLKECIGEELYFPFIIPEYAKGNWD